MSMDAELRKFVRTRANGRCEYCRLPDVAQRLPFHVEHIIAKQHGGNDNVENLAWACDRCNAYKGPNLSGIDPQT
jgi:5-methylcytosine-specific restriction endonuclease McrA